MAERARLAREQAEAERQAMIRGNDAFAGDQDALDGSVDLAASPPTGVRVREDPRRASVASITPTWDGVGVDPGTGRSGRGYKNRSTEKKAVDEKLVKGMISAGVHLKTLRNKHMRQGLMAGWLFCVYSDLSLMRWQLGTFCSAVHAYALR